MVSSTIFSIDNPEGWVLSIIESVLKELIESSFDVSHLVLSSFSSVFEFLESDLHLISDVFGFIVPHWSNAENPSGSSSSEFRGALWLDVVIILWSSHSSDVWHELNPGLFGLM